MHWFTQDGKFFACPLRYWVRTLLGQPSSGKNRVWCLALEQARQRLPRPARICRRRFDQKIIDQICLNVRPNLFRPNLLKCSTKFRRHFRPNFGADQSVQPNLHKNSTKSFDQICFKIIATPLKQNIYFWNVVEWNSVFEGNRPVLKSQSGSQSESTGKERKIWSTI